MPLEILSNRTKIQLTFNYFYASKNVGKILKIFHTITVNLDNVEFCLILRQKQRRPTIYEAWKTWISLSFWMFAYNPHCEQAFDVTLLSGFFLAHNIFLFHLSPVIQAKRWDLFQWFSRVIFFRVRFFFAIDVFLLTIEAFQNQIFFSWPKAKIVIMLRNTDTDGTLAEFEKFKTEYWIYVLDKLSVIKTKYKQMKRNISRWYPAFFLWVTVPFSISALQKVFPAQEQINKTHKKTKRAKGILKQRPHHFSAPKMSLTQSGNHWLTYPFQLSKSYLLFTSISFCSAFVSFFTKLRDLFEMVSIFHRYMKYHGKLLDFFMFNCKLSIWIFDVHSHVFHMQRVISVFILLKFNLFIDSGVEYLQFLFKNTRYSSVSSYVIQFFRLTQHSFMLSPANWFNYGSQIIDISGFKRTKIRVVHA